MPAQALVQDFGLSLAGWSSLARSLLCSKAMADAATTFVVDYEECGRENVREGVHTLALSSLSPSTGVFESV